MTNSELPLNEQERIALEVRAALNALANLIPRLELPHPATKKALRASRTVTKEQIANIIAVVEGSETLQRLGTFDVDEARETLHFADAFRSVSDQLAALLAAMNHTMEARKARVVAAALRTYAIAKGMARDERSADLYQALTSLRTHMRQSRRRDRVETA